MPPQLACFIFETGPYHLTLPGLSAITEIPYLCLLVYWDERCAPPWQAVSYFLSRDQLDSKQPQWLYRHQLWCACVQSIWNLQTFDNTPRGSEGRPSTLGRAEVSSAEVGMHSLGATCGPFCLGKCFPLRLSKHHEPFCQDRDIPISTCSPLQELLVSFISLTTITNDEISDHCQMIEDYKKRLKNMKKYHKAYLKI